MLFPIRQNVRLSGGTVTLRAWSCSVADSYLSDMLTLTVTLGTLRDEWHAFKRGDLEPGVWASFWRLVHASLEAGSALPQPLNWNDHLELLTAMWELNDVEEAAGKLMALTQRSARLLTRIQGQTTAPLTSSFSASSALSPMPA
ncbi:hypothetical protein ACI3L1_06715 [Deinococcus sp. SM5_A1]|uniref:hypothetical protein n=1 Tax=Deinococcus sp. SM5_A1 TaxID=3379094 RepID=UPI00385CE0BE